MLKILTIDGQLAGTYRQISEHSGIDISDLAPGHLSHTDRETKRPRGSVDSLRIDQFVGYTSYCISVLCLKSEV